MVNRARSIVKGDDLVITNLRGCYQAAHHPEKAFVFNTYPRDAIVCRGTAKAIYTEFIQHAKSVEHNSREALPRCFRTKRSICPARFTLLLYPKHDL